jgi:hypothetical protein
MVRASCEILNDMIQQAICNDDLENEVAVEIFVSLSKI